MDKLQGRKKDAADVPVPPVSAVSADGVRSPRSTLLIQHMQFLDGAVHSYAILPIIGAFVVFGGVLDADTVTAIHFTLPDGLLHTDIYLSLVGSVIISSFSLVLFFKALILLSLYSIPSLMEGL